MRSMAEQIPLMLIRRGVSIPIGMASIGEDGLITAQVAKEYWPKVKYLFEPNGGELSIQAPRLQTLAERAVNTQPTIPKI